MRCQIRLRQQVGAFLQSENPSAWLVPRTVLTTRFLHLMLGMHAPFEFGEKGLAGIT
jgi:hypothetical protein